MFRRALHAPGVLAMRAHNHKQACGTAADRPPAQLRGKFWMCMWHHLHLSDALIELIRCYQARCAAAILAP